MRCPSAAASRQEARRRAKGKQTVARTRRRASARRSRARVGGRRRSAAGAASVPAAAYEAPWQPQHRADGACAGGYGHRCSTTRRRGSARRSTRPSAPPPRAAAERAASEHFAATAVAYGGRRRVERRHGAEAAARSLRTHEAVTAGHSRCRRGKSSALLQWRRRQPFVRLPRPLAAPRIRSTLVPMEHAPPSPCGVFLQMMPSPAPPSNETRHLHGRAALMAPTRGCHLRATRGLRVQPVACPLCRAPVASGRGLPPPQLDTGARRRGASAARRRGARRVSAAGADGCNGCGEAMNIWRRA